MVLFIASEDARYLVASSTGRGFVVPGTRLAAENRTGRQVPEMARGGGVILQRYRDGGLADAKVFRFADGLTWRLGEKTRTETNLRDWIGERAQAGRLPPNGFPRSGRFA
jgi:topoisomerase-4 subunit A